MDYLVKHEVLPVDHSLSDIVIYEKIYSGDYLQQLQDDNNWSDADKPNAKLSGLVSNCNNDFPKAMAI
eukprot:scaffold11636_cov62-Cyclotella_meneghiniana.AAC.9